MAASPMMEKIYVDSEDEITNVIERLKKTKANDIAVVVPKGAILLQSIINLKLLKKQGDVLDKKVYLITADKLGRNLGAKAGLVVKRKIGLRQTLPEKHEEEEYTAVEEDPQPDSEAESKETPEIAEPEEEVIEPEEEVEDVESGGKTLSQVLTDDSDDQGSVERVLETASAKEEAPEEDRSESKPAEEEEYIPKGLEKITQPEAESKKMVEEAPAPVQEEPKKEVKTKKTKELPVTPAASSQAPRVLDLGGERRETKNREYGALKLDHQENIVRVDAITQRKINIPKPIPDIEKPVKTKPLPPISTPTVPKVKKRPPENKAVLNIDDLRSELGIKQSTSGLDQGPKIKTSMSKPQKPEDTKVELKVEPPKDKYELTKLGESEDQKPKPKKKISLESQVDYQSLSGNTLGKKKENTEEPKIMPTKKEKTKKFKSKKLSNSFKKIKKNRLNKKPEILPKKFIIIFGIFIFMLLLAGVIIGYILIPQADIVVSSAPQTVEERLRLEVTLDPEKLAADSHKILEGQLVEETIEINIDQDTTGQIEKQSKASGTITVYNEFDSTPQTLIATTRFESSDGLIFKTTKQIVVPGATIESGSTVPGTVKVTIEAENTGDKYNIGATSFKIPGFQGSPKYDGFYGKSTETMAGGESSTAKAVSEEDINSVKEKINQEANNLIQNLDTGEVVFLEDVTTKKYDESLIPAKDEAMDKIQVTINLDVKAIVFNKESLFEAIKKEFAVDHGWGDNLQSSSMEYQYFEVEKVDEDTVKFLVAFKGEAAPYIDLPDDIAEQIKGKKVYDAEKILQGINGVDQVDLTLNPSWFNQLPMLAKNINFRKTEKKVEESSDEDQAEETPEEDSVEEDGADAPQGQDLNEEI